MSTCHGEIKRLSAIRPCDKTACCRTHGVVDLNPLLAQLGLGLLARRQQLLLGPFAEIVPKDASGLDLWQRVVGRRLIKMLGRLELSQSCQSSILQMKGAAGTDIIVLDDTVGLEADLEDKGALTSAREGVFRISRPVKS